MNTISSIKVVGQLALRKNVISLVAEESASVHFSKGEIIGRVSLSTWDKMKSPKSVFLKFDHLGFYKGVVPVL
jgi:hypothetical protein